VCLLAAVEPVLPGVAVEVHLSPPPRDLEQALEAAHPPRQEVLHALALQRPPQPLKTSQMNGGGGGGGE